MSDFLMHNLMRASIEHKIASASRASVAAMDRVASAVDGLGDRVDASLVRVRTDMLEGFGDVRDSVEQVGRNLGEGIYMLNARAVETHHAIKALGLTAEVMSGNIVTGFTQTLERLDHISGELSEIKHAVLSPEETMALERGRTARILAERGSLKDALTYISSAIDNPNGMPMRHIYSLRTLRGLLFSGAYDTPQETVVNPIAAKAEFVDALRFAEGEASVVVEDTFATVLFGLGDYHAAYEIYEKHAARPKGQLAELNKARCLLAMGRDDAARAQFLSALDRDWTLALQMATDPLCQAHPEVAGKAMSVSRETARRALRDAIRPASAGDRPLEIAEKVAYLAQHAAALPKWVCNNSEAVRAFAATAPRMSQCGRATVKYGAMVPYGPQRSIENLLKEFSNHVADISRCAEALRDPNLAAEDFIPKIADWNEMRRASITAYSTLINRRSVQDKVVLLTKNLMKSWLLITPPELDARAYPTLTPEASAALKGPNPSILLKIFKRRAYENQAARSSIQYGGRVGMLEQDIAEKIRASLAGFGTSLNEELVSRMAPVRVEIERLHQEALAHQAADTAAIYELRKFIDHHNLDPKVQPTRAPSNSRGPAAKAFGS